jgi:hypothetical protein
MACKCGFTVKITLGAAFLVIAIVGLILLLFTATDWESSTLWFGVVGISFFIIFDLVWLISVSIIEHKTRHPILQEEALAQVETQNHIGGDQFGSGTASGLPTTGYSPKLLEEASRTERHAQMTLHSDSAATSAEVELRSCEDFDKAYEVKAVEA